MANGVIVDQATYYNDTDTYNGEPGSITNTYVIEDWIDLVSIPTPPSGTDTFYTLVSDIDLNDYDEYRYGLPSGEIFNWGYCVFDGGGHKIRNLIIKNRSDMIFRLHRMLNITFENLIFMSCDVGCSFINFYNGSTRLAGALENVRIGAYFFNSPSSSVLHPRSAGANINSCTFNLSGSTPDGICMNDTSDSYTRVFTNCQINADIKSYSENVITLSSAVTLDNSYITGCVQYCGMPKYQDGSTELIYSGKLSFSYVALKIDTSNTSLTKFIFSSVTQTNPSFIDVDLIDCDVDMDESDGMIRRLTTEQCKDTDYLVNNVGFPVVPAQ